MRCGVAIALMVDVLLIAVGAVVGAFVLMRRRALATSWAGFQSEYVGRSGVLNPERLHGQRRALTDPTGLRVASFVIGVLGVCLLVGSVIAVVDRV